MRLRVERCVYSGDKSLACRLLVSARPVYLTRVEKTRDALRLKRGEQLRRLDVIVFDRVSGARDVAFLESGKRPQESVLHFLWKRRRKPVEVNLVRKKAFRLHEKLVSLALGESHHFVLD